MSFAVPLCEKVRVLTFRGERGQYAVDFQRALLDAETQQGPDPSRFDCLRYAGHTGVSLDLGKTIYAFNPDGIGLPTWDLVKRLKRGDRFHGLVLDDWPIFDAIRKLPLPVLEFDVILPAPDFQYFAGQLASEFRKSRFWYSFPNQVGDCNCTTWLERMGLPLLTGRIDEFVDVFSVKSKTSRRFGLCV